MDIVETPWREKTSFHYNTHKSEIKEKTERTKQRIKVWKLKEQNKTKNKSLKTERTKLNKGWKFENKDADYCGLRRIEKTKLCFFFSEIFICISVYEENQKLFWNERTCKSTAFSFSSEILIYTTKWNYYHIDQWS